MLSFCLTFFLSFFIFVSFLFSSFFLLTDHRDPSITTNSGPHNLPISFSISFLYFSIFVSPTLLDMDCKGSPTFHHRHHLCVDPASSSISNLQATTPSTHLFVFSPVVEANYVRKQQDLSFAYKLTEEDKAEIRKLVEDTRIDKRIIKSIAPSIYGHKNIKIAIAVAMFGGQEKNVEGNLRLTGNINVLLLGKPGTAKSQFLNGLFIQPEKVLLLLGRQQLLVRTLSQVHGLYNVEPLS